MECWVAGVGGGGFFGKGEGCGAGGEGQGNVDCIRYMLGAGAGWLFRGGTMMWMNGIGRGLNLAFADADADGGVKSFCRRQMVKIVSTEYLHNVEKRTKVDIGLHDVDVSLSP